MHCSHAQEAVRAAEPGDLSQLAALAGAAAEEKATQRGGDLWVRRERRQGAPRTWLEAAVAAADQHVAVGLLHGAILGYAVVQLETLADGDVLGVLDEIYVDPEAREVGLGELLMDHVLEWCREHGCVGVDSLALPGDRQTKNFFESFGLVARAILVHRKL